MPPHRAPLVIPVAPTVEQLEDDVRAGDGDPTTEELAPVRAPAGVANRGQRVCIREEGP